MAKTQRALPAKQASPAELSQAYYYRAGSTVAMDMVAPYCVYVNGRCVAEYDDEDAADEHYFRLRTQMRQAH
jgi:hypothetical protein